jgi:hypothetical protein
LAGVHHANVKPDSSVSWYLSRKTSRDRTSPK